MNNIIETLEKRKNELEEINSRIDEQLINAPKGNIRLSKSKNTYQYQYVELPSDKYGKYMKKSQRELVSKIINRDYLIKLKSKSEEEIKDISRFLKKHTKNELENLYETAPIGRKKLITPLLVSDELYAKIWTNLEYVKNPYMPDECIYETKKGDMVRSKSEAMLADMYFDLGIPYRYEAPLQIGRYEIKYPDFTILDVKNRKEIYHEHFGMLDQDEYRYNNLKKINEYRKAGIYFGKNLIITFEDKGNPLNIRDLERMFVEMFNI